MIMCDAHLEQLREKRRQWIECLDGEDDNSITNQLTKMTWNITAFRVLMENAFDLAPVAEEGGKQLNWLLFGLLQESFLESLLLGLRRLMDPAVLAGPRGVCSLVSLLRDIGNHAHLLTRDAIIQLGPPDGIMKDGNHGDMFLQAWRCIRNRLIDELTRRPHDWIPRELFDRRRETLEKTFKDLEPLINTKIAHAATVESCKSRPRFDYPKILWSHLYDLHGDLCKTAHFLHNLICETGMNSFLPVFQGHEFQYLSRPIVAKKDLQGLADRWAELQAGYESWSNWRPGTSAGQNSV